METKVIGFVRYEEGHQGYRNGIAINRNINLLCEGDTSFEKLIQLREKFLEPLDEDGEWTDYAGNPIDLTNEDLKSGICCVAIDYVTYYTTTINQLDDDEWRAFFSGYGDCRWGKPAYAAEMIAYLEDKYGISIDADRLKSPNQLNTLRIYLEKNNPDQDEFEAEMYMHEDEE